MTQPTIAIRTLLTEDRATCIMPKFRPICLTLAAELYKRALASGLNPIHVELDDGAGNVWTWSARGGMRGLLGQWMGRAGL
jgi:hypothetical protein